MLKFKPLGNWVNALFAPKCLLCDAAQVSTDGLCNACRQDLPWQPQSACPQCGLASNGQICGACLRDAPHFDATHAVFSYDFPIDSMMQGYKYGDALYLSHIFGAHLAKKVRLSAVDLVIAMPMHPQRLKERGFNQAFEIAKVLHQHPSPSQGEGLGGGQITRAQLAPTLASRTKLTPPQASLPLKDRVKNIKGAFAVHTDLSGKHIAIVDDVMTSGASLNELAKTLKNAGASHVECWVVARTLPHK